MNKSTKDLIKKIIELDDCPFTEFEVHGFFVGLILSSAEQNIKKEKMMKFLDLSAESEPLTEELIKAMSSELSNNYLEIYPESDYAIKDNSYIANALSEWTYYFLISFQNSSSPDDDLREKEILDIFDEISQINQKYQTDDECSPKDNFTDINSFITKSVLYLFQRNLNEK